MNILLIAITLAILAALLAIAFLAGLSLGFLVAGVTGIHFAEQIADRLDGGWTEIHAKPADAGDDDEDGDRWKRGDYSAN